MVKKKYILSKEEVKEIKLLSKNIKTSALAYLYNVPIYFIGKVLRGEYIGEEYVGESIIPKSEG